MESITGISGYGKSPFEELVPIFKAFEAGQDFNIAGLTGSQAGRIQSLQSSFVDWINFESSARFIKFIPRTKIASPVVEYARLEEIGRGSIFFPEGGDVDWIADRASRQYDIVKYLGTKMEVTGPAELTNFIQPAEVSETIRKGRSFIRALSESCIFGDSLINNLEFDGILNQVTRKVTDLNSHVIDLRGKVLRDTKINDGVTTIRRNLGMSTLKLFLSYDGINGYTQGKIQNSQYFTNAEGTPRGIAPTDQFFERFKVSNGSGEVIDDIFLGPQSALLAGIVSQDGASLVKTASKAPDAPTLTGGVLGTATSTNANGYALANDTYEYLIVPENEYGLGVGLEASATTSGGGKMVTFSIIAAGTGNPTLGYRIYRRPGSSSALADYKFLFRVKKAAPTVTQDDGEWLPGTSWGILTEIDGDQVFDLAQYGEMMKVPYGQRADKREWLMKYYGVFRVKNPKRIVLFKNVGMDLS